MSKAQITAIAIQMVSRDDIAHNVDTATRLLKEAVVEKEPDLVVFPENFLCFGNANQAFLANHLSSYLEKFQALASQLSVNLVLGSLPTFMRQDGSQTDGRLRSACHVIDSKGGVCAQYDKLHLFDVNVDDAHGSYRESDDFEPGDAIKLVDVAGCRLGLSICYDLRFPNLFQRLRNAGAEVMALPAAFTKVTGEAHWEVLLRARAIETQSYLIAANQGGFHGGLRETWGHSMIVSPWGEVMAECGQGEGYCSASLDFKRLHEIRASMPVQEHSRIQSV